MLARGLYDVDAGNEASMRPRRSCLGWISPGYAITRKAIDELQ
jgi:hypothetical protein